MLPLDALLFDLGGTLDGRGSWRERFHRLLPEAGIVSSHEDRVAAFDYAERRSHAGAGMTDAGLRDLVAAHVGWQLESLRVDDEQAERTIIDRFVCDAEAAAAVNRQVLSELAALGIKLGVVSNACGNAARLCAEFGYARLLTAIVDSHLVGASKPDPAIFRRGLALVGTAAARTGFVGDRLDRDIEPAKSIGMTTFWIAGDAARSTATSADIVLQSIADLPAAIRGATTLGTRYA